MSRERDLLRKILDKTNYINYACNDKIRNEIMEFLFQPEQTEQNKAEAIMPNGVRVSNVYDAYEEGRKSVMVEQKPEVIDENTSDGYHTFKELYEFRKACNVALFNEWGANNKCYTHKSWRHNDGELCFGGGWFIVVSVLPQGQISNHYEAKDWDLFSIPEVEKALFEFDGHTGADVVERLKLYTALKKCECITPRQGLEEYKKGYTKAEQDLKREPLSDEAICEILLKKEWKGFVELVRQVERLHGIGVE